MTTPVNSYFVGILIQPKIMNGFSLIVSADRALNNKKDAIARVYFAVVKELVAFGLLDE